MTTIKQALKGKLTKKEMQSLRTSYDIIGSIAVVEIPPGLKKKEKLIADTLLKLHKNITTVLKKAGIHKGKYRRQKFTVIAGKKTKTAEYKENNAVLRLDVEKVYFSPRLGTERKRIYQLVKPGEKVLVMFSGCAPYPAVIARNTKAEEIYGIELNPAAHKFAEENIKLNKIKNVRLIKGDANEEAKKLKKKGIKFDRIIMPLPKDAGIFIGAAFAAAKKGAVIHFYDFANEDEFKEKKEKIKEMCRTHRKKCRILRVAKCGHYAPRVYRICIDFKVLG
jgi:tRNA (guanine37-N1)-methyltransferase